MSFEPNVTIFQLENRKMRLPQRLVFASSGQTADLILSGSLWLIALRVRYRRLSKIIFAGLDNECIGLKL